MLGLIRKSKAYEIIEVGEIQLINKQLEIIKMKEELSDEDFLESIHKLEGGILALRGLKKHFL